MNHYAGKQTQPIRITTGARLHFGLLRPTSPFGGAGVMIDQPFGEVLIEPADQFVCDQEHESRVRPIAQRWGERLGLETLPACRIKIGGSLKAHCGLGSGTQWSLAVAEGLAQFLKSGFASNRPDQNEWDCCDLDSTGMATQIAERGKRSAVGVHGYFHGGMIHEAPCDKTQRPSSQSSTSDVNRQFEEGSVPLNPIVDRIELPETWCVAFLTPQRQVPQVSGHQEAELFSSLPEPSEALFDELKVCLRKELVPAARAGDFSAFSEAVHRYNHQSGMLFANVQGGPYNGREVSDLIDLLTESGIKGVGQSSWGPGVFAWFESREAFGRFQADHSQRLPPATVASVRNSGRALTVGSP